MSMHMGQIVLSFWLVTLASLGHLALNESQSDLVSVAGRNPDVDGVGPDDCEAAPTSMPSSGGPLVDASSTRLRFFGMRVVPLFLTP